MMELDTFDLIYRGFLDPLERTILKEHEATLNKEEDIMLGKRLRDSNDDIDSEECYFKRLIATSKLSIHLITL